LLVQLIAFVIDQVLFTQLYHKCLVPRGSHWITK
jgi:hypothetical protein